MALLQQGAKAVPCQEFALGVAGYFGVIAGDDARGVHHHHRGPEILHVPDILLGV